MLSMPGWLWARYGSMMCTSPLPALRSYRSAEVDLEFLRIAESPLPHEFVFA